MNNMYTPSKEWCEPFILQEQHIRKIVEIIEKRRLENAGSEYDPIYQYKRLDDYERTTNDINDLFKEDNCGGVRITSLKISSKHYFRAHSGLNYEIEFNSCENSEEFDFGFRFFKSITLGIRGENRDIGELLFNELNNYITNTIISHKHKKIVWFLKKMTSRTILPFFPLFLWIPVFFLQFLKSPQSNLQEIIDNAISSTNISEKLDALLQLQKIQQNVGISEKELLYIVVIILIVFIADVVLNFSKVKRKLYYYYPFVFDFGTSSEDYKARISRIKWIIGIIGALILGVLGNFLYNIISRI